MSAMVWWFLLWLWRHDLELKSVLIQINRSKNVGKFNLDFGLDFEHETCLISNAPSSTWPIEGLRWLLLTHPNVYSSATTRAKIIGHRIIDRQSREEQMKTSATDFWLPLFWMFIWWASCVFLWQSMLNKMKNLFTLFMFL